MKEADDGSTWSTTTLNVDAAMSNGTSKKGISKRPSKDLDYRGHEPSSDFYVGDRARTLPRFASTESRFQRIRENGIHL